jgi:hypothetical protein
VSDPAKNGAVTKIFAYQETDQIKEEQSNQPQSEIDHSQHLLSYDGAEATPAFSSQPALTGNASVDEQNYVPSQFEATSEPASYAVSKDPAMNQMVDDLLEDDENSTMVPYDNDGRIPTTPHHQTFNLASSPPPSNQFTNSPNLENFQAFYPGQGDFVLFSSTSPQALGSSHGRTRDEVEVAEMTRRLSNMGRSGSQSSPMSRPLPAFPSLPDESARIWGMGFPGSPAAPPASAGFPRPTHSSNHSSISYNNGFSARDNIGTLAPSPWPQFPSPTSDTFHHETAQQASMANDSGYLSSGFDQSAQRSPHSPSRLTGAPGSFHPPSGLGSAALGGSAWSAPGTSGIPGVNRRAQWPAS